MTPELKSQISALAQLGRALTLLPEAIEAVVAADANADATERRLQALAADEAALLAKVAALRATLSAERADAKIACDAMRVDATTAAAAIITDAESKAAGIIATANAAVEAAKVRERRAESDTRKAEKELAETQATLSHLNAQAIDAAALIAKAEAIRKAMG